MNDEKITGGKQIISELAEILRELSDSDVDRLLDNNTMTSLLKAILDTSKVTEYPNIAEFFFANKTRSTLLAWIRLAIHQNYSINVPKEGQEAFVSPYFEQWFDDGVMFLEGSEPFAGFLGLQRNNELRYAIAARDLRNGQELGKDDFEFISIDDFNERLRTIPPEQITDLERPVIELNELLNTKETNESEYQELIQKYPWILGAKYTAVQNHIMLDDENIPDFTGVRVHDSYRDIIEIKPPFIPLFRQNGNFNSAFNDAWNQAERYLNFVREETDYLRRKGLNFDNPRCYLIRGYDIPDDKLKKIRAKEKLNPAIEFRTYNDLIVFAKNTVEFLKRLKLMQ